MPSNNSTIQTVNTTRINIHQILESVSGFKGKDFPAAWLGVKSQTGATDSGGNKAVELADNGTVLRKKDLLGGYYFMPVSLSGGGKTCEIDCALVSARMKKTIVRTPMAGYDGSVKELIGTQDMEISITGCLMGQRGCWPEERINTLRELFQVNDSVSLKCALTDCFFDIDDRVVLTDLNFPTAMQVEDIVPVRIACIRDQVFELNLK